MKITQKVSNGVDGRLRLWAILGHPGASQNTVDGPACCYKDKLLLALFYREIRPEQRADLTGDHHDRIWFKSLCANTKTVLGFHGELLLNSLTWLTS
jgi:hypothetical protein